MKNITESIRVSRHSECVHLNMTVLTATGDWFSNTIIVTRDVARALAAGLVEMADTDDMAEAVAS